MEVLPPPLREFRGARSGPFGSIADAVEEVHGDDFQPAYDVFISHATEDKDDLVRPLAEALRERGLDVWYDEFELKVGARFGMCSRRPGTPLVEVGGRRHRRHHHRHIPAKV